MLINQSNLMMTIVTGLSETSVYNGKQLTLFYFRLP
jgi:hypothetical protein